MIYCNRVAPAVLQLRAVTFRKQRVSGVGKEGSARCVLKPAGLRCKRPGEAEVQEALWARNVPPKVTDTVLTVTLSGRTWQRSSHGNVLYSGASVILSLQRDTPEVSLKRFWFSLSWKKEDVFMVKGYTKLSHSLLLLSEEFCLPISIWFLL